MASLHGNSNGQQPTLVRCPGAGCTWTSTTPSMLGRHVRGHDRSYACSAPGCTKAYNRKDALNEHEWAAHGLNSIWICYFGGCKRKGYGLANKSRLEHHLAGHGISCEQNCELEEQAKSAAADANMASGTAVGGADEEDPADE
ncbi:hypothetical protein PG993_009266 [Apiospora rasikravindrae]|uniref:C2H2-type domain-containing protein n=1 Tax=Apiospora rasikravindrae TaxID=990691 RepID=A0ABR1SIW8_9PEZI